MLFGKVPGEIILLNDHNIYMSYVTPYEAPSLNISIYLNQICENYRVKRTPKWPKIVYNFPYQTLCNLESHENFLRWLWISIHVKTSFLALSKLSFSFVCQIFSKLCPQTYCQRTKN